MHMLPRPLVFALVFVALAGSLSAQGRERTFVAGQNLRMKVAVPPGYSFRSESGNNGMTLVRMENPVWQIYINVLISPDYSAEKENERWQRDLVVAQSADFLASSKEQDYKFMPLKPLSGSGVFCTFTDPDASRPEELGPDEFMHVVVGAKVIRGAVMYFQIFNNDVRSQEFQEVFDLFVSGFDAA
jgi:hypothetical protein